MKDDEMRTIAESFKDYEFDLVLGSPEPMKDIEAYGQEWEEGKLLEYAVIRALRDVADEVVWPRRIYRPIVVDGKVANKETEQLDVALLIHGRWWMVECKDESKPVNYEPVAKMRELVGRRPPGTLGLVLSRKGFTPAAIDLSGRTASLSVLLMSVSELAELRSLKRIKEGLAVKLREASVSGVPDYDSTRDSKIKP